MKISGGATANQTNYRLRGVVAGFSPLVKRRPRDGAAARKGTLKSENQAAWTIRKAALTGTHWPN